MAYPNSLSRFWHTIRHLRTRQILGQVHLRLRPLCENPQAFGRRNIPDFPGCSWQPAGDFLAPGPQENPAADLLRGTFTFLSRSENCGWPPEWEDENRSRLWQYNLHYFEWLWALDYDKTREAVCDWIRQYDLRRNRVGWESYPISLRLMNWCAVFWGRFRKETESDAVFRRDLWKSIFLQAEWLIRHLEIHLLGNHLLENAAALTFAGSCFDGLDARRWYRLGTRILAEEIKEQILPDGMHFERSPMYHTRLTYLFILLVNMGRPDVRELLERPLVRMLGALAKVSHPDGEIALLNDSAFGIYSTPAQLAAAAGAALGKGNPAPGSPLGPWALPHAGYYGFRRSDGFYLICDAGLIGPDYVPGHAHGDIFSFELSLKGQRVIVDSGVYDYEFGEMREYCRSTAAHNTVTVNGRDQCEFWEVFRVGRRGRPHDVLWEPSEKGFRLAGAHNGYRHLPGRPVHFREFNWHPSGTLAVNDRVVATRLKDVVARVHLHPDCQLETATEQCAIVRYSHGRFRIDFSGAESLSAENAWYCPRFNCRLPVVSLAAYAHGHRVEMGFTISPL